MKALGIVPAHGLLALGLCTALSGCGLFGENGMFRDRKSDYEKSTSIAPLKIPAGLHEETIEDIYRVPQINPGNSGADIGSVPRPPPLMAGGADDLVKIQSAGRAQWILVQLLPGQVWPNLKDFLLIRRIGVGREDGIQGTIETPWLQEPQQAFSEIFRFEVLQGIQRNTAEIHVLQVQRRSDGVSRSRPPNPWPDDSDDSRREQLMLQQFASYLGNTADVNASVSLIAQGINVSQRMSLVPGATPLVRVNLDSERAWASLGQALDRAQFDVLAEDQPGGFYTVRPMVIEEKPGAWKRFTGMFSSADKDQDSQMGYRFKLKPAAQPGWTDITVIAVDGDVPPLTQEQMLTSVMAFLS